MSELERASDGKTEFYFNYTAKGESLAAGLQATLEESIAKLPIPKLMTYQRPDGETVQFVRPVHGLMALLDETLIPVSLLGLPSSRTTLGHRFLSKKTALSMPSASHYADLLREEGRVIASFAERKEKSVRISRRKQVTIRSSCPNRCSMKLPRSSNGQ